MYLSNSASLLQKIFYSVQRVKWNFEVRPIPFLTWHRFSSISKLSKLCKAHTYTFFSTTQKFLVNGQGKVVQRYSSLVEPNDIKKDIEKLLWRVRTVPRLWLLLKNFIALYII